MTKSKHYNYIYSQVTSPLFVSRNSENYLSHTLPLAIDDDCLKILICKRTVIHLSGVTIVKDCTYLSLARKFKRMCSSKNGNGAQIYVYNVLLKWEFAVFLILIINKNVLKIRTKEKNVYLHLSFV